MSEQHHARRGLFSRLLPHAGREPAEIPAPSGVEPCMGCGEETAVGSIFFSDRRSVTTAAGSRVLLCSECQTKAHHARKGEPLTDEDLRTIAGNGTMIVVGFLTGGGH